MSNNTPPGWSSNTSSGSGASSNPGNNPAGPPNNPNPWGPPNNPNPWGPSTSQNPGGNPPGPSNNPNPWGPPTSQNPGGNPPASTTGTIPWGPPNNPGPWANPPGQNPGGNPPGPPNNPNPWGPPNNQNPGGNPPASTTGTIPWGPSNNPGPWVNPPGQNPGGNPPNPAGPPTGQIPGGNPPGSTTGTKTFAETQATQTRVLPSFIKQSEYIANYFTADLTEVIALTNFNLATELNLPSNYFRNNADIIAMLYDDIAHMLRDNLIVGIHLLLSDKDMDRSLGAYPVRYHAQYTIVPAEAGVTPNLSQPDFGRPLAPPPDVIRQTQLILLIDWNPRAQSSRSHLRRPSYNFDWVPEAARFDATTVLHYRSGSLSVDGAVVKRSEKY